MTTTVYDLDAERLTKRCSEMDDETLVFCMLGLLQPSMSGPVAAGASTKAATCARTAFMEISKRWIPLEVFAHASKSILEGEEGDDA